MNYKKLLYAWLFQCSIVLASPVQLLIKIPTRSRPDQFFKNLDLFYQNLSFKVSYLFLITCDEDDQSMNNSNVIRRLNAYPNLEFSFSKNNSKVQATNRNIDKYDFDMVLVVHDDMVPVVKGYDKIIVDTMKERFPNYDGVLNFNDGYVGGNCNTLPVIGKNFYKRFGYVYHPDYKALVSNVELTSISKILRKEHIVDQVIIKHNHPAWQAGPMDDLYRRNESFHEQDLITYIKHRERHFNLTPSEINKATPKLWSILICTIEERKESFNRLCTKLKKQCADLGLRNEIEILAFEDKKGEHTIGFKRNRLLYDSQGIYISFIDDDDNVHHNFIQMIYERLQRDPDCVSLTGIITFNGGGARQFIHSIRYKEYFERDNTFYRPCNHLNPIKRSIAVQFSFPEKNYWEDREWAKAIAQSGLLKKEEFIDIPYYFYLFQDK